MLPSYLAYLAYLAVSVCATGYLDAARCHLAKRPKEALPVREISEKRHAEPGARSTLHGEISEISEKRHAPIQAVPAAGAWRHRPQRCATCGAEPIGRYQDGSPRYGCYDPATHRPIFPVTA